MKLILYLGIFSITSSVWAVRCLKKYHFWRPFNGEHSPENDFLAGIDLLGKKFHIGKIITPLESRSWTLSTQLTHDYVDFAFEDGKVFRVDRCMEILSVEPRYRSKLTWYFIQTDNELDFIHQYRNFCLVLGGVFKFRDTNVVSYIGRYYMNGTFFIGPVFTVRWAMQRGFHFLNGLRPNHRTCGFEILVHYA